MIEFQDLLEDEYETVCCVSNNQSKYLIESVAKENDADPYFIITKDFKCQCRIYVNRPEYVDFYFDKDKYSDTSITETFRLSSEEKNILLEMLQSKNMNYPEYSNWQMIFVYKSGIVMSKDNPEYFEYKAIEENEPLDFPIPDYTKLGE